MTTNKPIFYLLLSVLIVLTLTACGVGMDEFGNEMGDLFSEVKRWGFSADITVHLTIVYKDYVTCSDGAIANYCIEQVGYNEYNVLTTYGYVRSL